MELFLKEHPQFEEIPAIARRSVWVNWLHEKTGPISHRPFLNHRILRNLYQYQEEPLHHLPNHLLTCHTGIPTLFHLAGTFVYQHIYENYGVEKERYTVTLSNDPRSLSESFHKFDLEVDKWTFNKANKRDHFDGSWWPPDERKIKKGFYHFHSKRHKFLASPFDHTYCPSCISKTKKIFTGARHPVTRAKLFHYSQPFHPHAEQCMRTTSHGALYRKHEYFCHWLYECLSGPNDGDKVHHSQEECTRPPPFIESFCRSEHLANETPRALARLLNLKPELFVWRAFQRNRNHISLRKQCLSVIATTWVSEWLNLLKTRRPKHQWIGEWDIWLAHRPCFDDFIQSLEKDYQKLVAVGCLPEFEKLFSEHFVQKFHCNEIIPWDGNPDDSSDEETQVGSERVLHGVKRLETGFHPNYYKTLPPKQTPVDHFRTRNYRCYNGGQKGRENLKRIYEFDSFTGNNDDLWTEVKDVDSIEQLEEFYSEPRRTYARPFPSNIGRPRRVYHFDRYY